jgi:hypothetical protein
MPEAIRDKYQYFTQANLARLRAAGYAAPVTSLEDAVSDYVRNYLVPDKRLDPAVALNCRSADGNVRVLFSRWSERTHVGSYDCSAKFHHNVTCR